MKGKLKSISCNWINLFCCISTIVIFAISTTPITGFCSGVCTGLFIADTIWGNAHSKNKSNKKNKE